MTTYLFAGPSVPHNVREECATRAVVLPPVAGGDLLRVKARKGDVIGIIDGFFYRRPAVKHKEILDLLASGVKVYGAASMGALRAAELADFGMVGIGRVFNDYRHGVVIGDDEVALLHGTEAENYEPYTMALINVRYALMDAARCGQLRDDVANQALEAASQLPFMDRTFEAIVDSIHRRGLSDADFSNVKQVLRATPDVKQADAMELIKALFGETTVERPESKCWNIRETVYLRGWRATAAGIEEPDIGWVPDTQISNLAQVLAIDYPSFREGVALRALAAENAADSDGCIVQGDGIHRAVVERLRYLGILGPDAETNDGLERWCTVAEITELPPIVRTARAATRALFVNPELKGRDPFLQELKSTAGYTLARERLLQCLRFNLALLERRPNFQLSRLDPERILAHFGRKWRRTDLDDAALERGFATVQEFVDRARPYYLYDKFQPNIPPLRIKPEYS